MEPLGVLRDDRPGVLEADVACGGLLRTLWLFLRIGDLFKAVGGCNEAGLELILFRTIF